MIAPDRKTRVLHIIRNLNLGGAERVVVNYARYCSRDKFETYICCLNEGGPLLEEARQHAAGVYVLNKGRLGLIALIRLIRILQQEKIDVLHAHLLTAHLWGGIAGLVSRTPCVLATEHNVVADKRFPLLKRFLWHTFDRIIAVSEAVSFSHMRQWRIPNKKMVVIRNGVSPPEDDDNLPNKTDPVSTLGLADNAKIVLNVGNLTEQKAQHFFIEAADEVLQQFPNASFLIVGEGEERPRLEGLINDKSLQEKVKLLGSRTDVASIIRKSSCLVLSSLWEGLPLTILEAMAAGKPVVVTDVGGNREAVRDGATGYAVPPCRPDILAERILKLLNDEKLSEKLGECGKHRHQAEFSVERQIRETEELYNEILLRGGQDAILSYHVSSSGRQRSVNAMSSVLCATGISRISKTLSRSARSRVFIMNYHNFMNPARFEQHLLFFVKNFDILSLGDFVRACERGAPPARDSVVLTFDDGYRSVYARIFPLLKEYGVPASVFLATDHISSDRPLWFHLVEALLVTTEKQTVELAGQVFPLRSKRERISAIRKAKDDILKKVPEVEKNKFLRELGKQLGDHVNPDMLRDYQLLTWEQVREMSESGINFGSHSASHPILSRIDADQLDRELKQSKREIESHIGEEIRFFAYPNGRADDFNDTVIESLKRHGYKCALTTIPGACYVGDRLFELKRVQLHQYQTVSSVKAKMTLWLPLHKEEHID